MDDPSELMNEPIYTIGLAAKKLNVSVATLRMYEQAGLIITHRTGSNRRLYSYNDLSRIQVMLDLIRNHGLNIESIKYIYSLVPCWKIMSCADEIREKCDAYRDSRTPCWAQPCPPCAKSPDDCRHCRVYMDFTKLFQNAKAHFREYMQGDAPSSRENQS